MLHTAINMILVDIGVWARPRFEALMRCLEARASRSTLAKRVLIDKQECPLRNLPSAFYFSIALLLHVPTELSRSYNHKGRPFAMSTCGACHNLTTRGRVSVLNGRFLINEAGI